jgi:CheY-like chemotaxis protein
VQAADGETGIALARREAPAAITLDVLMPGMDGWAVLGKLKDDPALADIPVVMVTILDERRLGFALGATEYLTKPVKREELLEALERARDPSALVAEVKALIETRDGESA